jgi:hypothetical protein
MTVRPRRLARALVAIVGLAAMLGIALAPAGAADQPAPGQGSAIAQTMKVDPKAGSLSLGVTFGEALAAHQNSVAQAASQAINLGVIGTTLGSEGCDGSAPTYPSDQQPQPLRVDSRDAGADKGKTESEDNAFSKYVRADGTPLGEAVTTAAPFGIAGVLEVGGGTARTHSGLVNGAREAQATVDVSGLNLAGVVDLSSLHWEATYRSTGDNKVTGSFTIGHATIAGTAVPTNDPSATLAQANTALSLLGLKLVPGTAHQEGGVLFVDPLTISVVPNAQRDAVAGAVIGGIQPVRQSLFDALLAQSCKNSSYITIFDLVVGSVTGAGEFALSLGGAQASSSEIAQNKFNLAAGTYDFGGGALPAATDTATGLTGPADNSGTLGAVTDAGTPAAGSAPTAAGPSSSGHSHTAVQPIGSAFKGTRGGALAAVAGITLALLAALVEGDRRKMRRAQREIPT